MPGRFAPQPGKSFCTLGVNELDEEGLKRADDLSQGQHGGRETVTGSQLRARWADVSDSEGEWEQPGGGGSSGCSTSEPGLLPEPEPAVSCQSEQPGGGGSSGCSTSEPSPLPEPEPTASWQAEEALAFGGAREGSVPEPAVSRQESPPEPADDGGGGPFANVLGARDLYAAIGAPARAPESELRRSYLRVGVRAHPGATSCADGARAFVQASAAWAELSSAPSRWRYDAELQAGRGLLVGPSPHRCLPVTAEKALALFAAAAAHCEADADTPPCFSDTLRCARRLAARQEGAAAGGDDDSQGPTLQSVACGVVGCAGLAAAGATATAAGYPGLGAMAGRAAVYQGVSQAAMTGVGLYQHNETVRESVDGARTAVGEYLEVLCSSWTSCLAGKTPKTPPDARCGRPYTPPRCKEQAALGAGCRVRLVGLQRARSLNGRTGEVIGLKGVRYAVRLLGPAAPGAGPTAAAACAEDEVKLLKVENLEILPPSTPTASLVPSPARSSEAPAGVETFI